MNIDFNEYKLRCELHGHDDDVRGICVCSDENIASSSRDRTIRVWSLDPSDKRKYTSSKILLGHNSFVGPLAWIPPTDEYPEGRLVSGSMDTFVFVWNLMNGENIQKLKGHHMQVTGVTLDNEDIVSSSVDQTLKRWRNGQLVESWEAHQSPVQAVIKLPSGELVSGSSDASLKLWKGKTNLRTLSGHTDTVRGLAVMPDLGFLSASHDSSIRLWALSGEVLLEMVGHTSIVYSVDSHASGLIVSGSEDRHAKIWKDGVCVQSLEHPGCVWDAKFLESGDIVTACSDGVVRVWTVRHGVIADQMEIDAYDSQLSQYKLSRKKVGGMKLDELPGLDSLTSPGTSDGQTKVVREGDNGVAYAWNMKEQRWDKIGEVVDGPDGVADRPSLVHIQSSDDDTVEFDINTYIEMYSPSMKITRLLFLADCLGVSEATRLKALTMAYRLIKIGDNSGLLRHVLKKLNGEVKDDDTSWLKRADIRFAERKKKIEGAFSWNREEHKTCIEYVRLQYKKLGDLHYECGCLQDALTCYTAMRSKCNTESHLVDAEMMLILVSLKMAQYEDCLRFVSRAKAYDSLDKINLDRLTCASGLAHLALKSYHLAASEFLRVDSKSGNIYPDVLLPRDAATYGALCSLATFDRSETKHNIIDHIGNNNAWRILGLTPQLRKCIKDFYERDYSQCLQTLDHLKENLRLDIYLSIHVDTLYTLIREKAITEYIKPFSHLKMKTMAAVFNTTMSELEKELDDMIRDNKLQAHIVSHSEAC